MPVAKLITRLCLFAALLCAMLIGVAVGVGRGMPGGVLAYVSEVPEDYPASNIYMLDTNLDRTYHILQDNGISSISWSPDGQRIVLDRHLDGGSYLNVIDANGRNYRELFYGNPSEPSWSPDGRWIAFNAPYPHDAIYVSDPSGQPIEQVLSDESSVYRHIGTIAWSPDSSHIAFVSNGDISYIYTLRLADKQIEVLIDNRSGELELRPFFYIAWSPNGQRIALTSNDGIYIVNVENKRVEHIYTCLCDQVAWSSDGKWLAFDNQMGTPDEAGLYAINIDDLSVRRLTYNSADRSPAWWPLP